MELFAFQATALNYFQLNRVELARHISIISQQLFTLWIKQVDTKWTLNEMLSPANRLNFNQIRLLLVRLNLVQRQKLNPTMVCHWGGHKLRSCPFLVTQFPARAHRDPEGDCSEWGPSPLHFWNGLTSRFLQEDTGVQFLVVEVGVRAGPCTIQIMSIIIQMITCN